MSPPSSRNTFFGFLRPLNRVDHYGIIGIPNNLHLNDIHAIEFLLDSKRFFLEQNILEFETKGDNNAKVLPYKSSSNYIWKKNQIQYNFWLSFVSAISEDEIVINICKYSNAIDQ
jgi:hypothetical protein